MLAGYVSRRQAAKVTGYSTYTRSCAFFVRCPWSTVYIMLQREGVVTQPLTFSLLAPANADQYRRTGSTKPGVEQTGSHWQHHRRVAEI